MPVEPQPTPEEVELAADAIAKVWGYSNLAAADSVQDGDPYAVRKSARAVLAALAEAGRLRQDQDALEARVRTQVAEEIAAEISGLDPVEAALLGKDAWVVAAAVARRHAGPSGTVGNPAPRGEVP